MRGSFSMKSQLKVRSSTYWKEVAFCSQTARVDGFRIASWVCSKVNTIAWSRWKSSKYSGEGMTMVIAVKIK